MDFSIEDIDHLASCLPGRFGIYALSGTVRMLRYAADLPDLLGHTPEEYEAIANEDALATVWPEDRAALLKSIDAKIKQHDDAAITCRILKKDGTFFWTLAHSRIVGEFEGNYLMVTLFTDITEMKQAEFEAAESRRRYEMAVDSAHLGVWEYDIRTHCITSSSEGFRKLGIPARVENVPDSIMPMVLEQDRPALIDMYEQLEQGADYIEGDFWMRWRPGTPLRCERVIYSAQKDENGRPTIAYGIGQNVTAEKGKELEYQLTAQELLAADPNALCMFRLNLSQNTCREERGTSPATQRMLSADTADQLFANIIDIISNDEDRKQFERMFTRKALIDSFSNGHKRQRFDYRRMGEDGSVHWVTTSLTMLQNPVSDDVEAVIHSVDITDSRKEQSIVTCIVQEEFDSIALISVKNRTVEFRNMQEDAKDTTPHARTDYDEDIAYAFAIVDPDNVEQDIAALRLDHVLEELEHAPIYAYDFNLIDGNGNTFRKVVKYCYVDDTRQEILLSRLDITDFYNAQQKELIGAKQEADTIRDIFDSISIGICKLIMPDPDHMAVDFVNEQMFRILGYVDEDGAEEFDRVWENPLVKAYRADAFMAVHPEDRERVRATCRTGFSQRHFTIGDYRLLSVTEGFLWVRQDLELREVLPDGSRVFYATYRDVSEEVRLHDEIVKRLEREQSLRQEAVAANKAKSAFLSSVSHDMRTPLNGVLGYTELAKKTDDPKLVGDYLDKICKAGNVLLQLINDTLDLSKIETGATVLKPVPISAYKILDDLLTAMKPSMDAKDIDFVVDVSKSPMAPIRVDVIRVREILLNLLNNAVKFTPEGGTITFTVERLSVEGDVYHELVSVSDTGCGISEEFLPQIFEPFTQERRKANADVGGAGLGLSIVKGLVELMGGTIEVESEVGVGTTFRVHFMFERADDEDLARANAKKGIETHLEGMRALLVEDNDMNAEIAIEMLGREGVEVVRARNGKEGVDTFADSPVGGFDTVLMDIRMPVMDGYAAAGAIRALGRPDAATVPIIAMSADAYETDVQKSKDAGMNAHVSKPVDFGKLMEELGQFRAELQ